MTTAEFFADYHNQPQDAFVEQVLAKIFVNTNPHDEFFTVDLPF